MRPFERKNLRNYTEIMGSKIFKPPERPFREVEFEQLPRNHGVLTILNRIIAQFPRTLSKGSGVPYIKAEILLKITPP